jgi:hypothetical protein
MPTRRTHISRKRVAISPEAVAAWRACDYIGLHRALRLHPSEPSPLPLPVTALGCDPSEEAYDDDGWRRAVELQRELLRIAGAPDYRESYRENLSEAEARVAYCRFLVDNPGQGSRGTGSDLESREKALAEALEALEYRQALWDSLPKLPH